MSPTVFADLLYVLENQIMTSFLGHILFRYHGDMGCPSVYVLPYRLMNKAVSTNELAKYSQMGNLKQKKI